jgi:hypothetical protein
MGQTVGGSPNFQSLIHFDKLVLLFVARHPRTDSFLNPRALLNDDNQKPELD